MKIKVFTLGLLQANCYLIYDDRQCVIVDPGACGIRYLEPLFDYIASHSLMPLGILLTHVHFDHIGGVDECVQLYNCPVFLHESEVDSAGDPERNLSAPLLRRPLSVCSQITPVSDGSVLFPNTAFTTEVLYTPGHSSGSCCYFCGNAVFTGDTLFYGSVGRTDFPDGSTDLLLKSLDKLKNHCGGVSMTAYPGHGPETVLPEEFHTNIYYKRG